MGYLVVLIISRRYGTEGMGIYSLTLSLITFVAMVASMGMNISILRIDATIDKIEDFLEVDNIRLNTSLKSNSASEPRFKFINSLIYRSNKSKKSYNLLSFLQSQELRFYSFIDILNQKPTTKNKLSESDKEKIMKKCFENKTEALTKFLNSNQNEWRSL